MCQPCRISPGMQSWKMLLCPVYCSTIAFSPTRLQHHLGKAMVCKLACFSPMVDLFLAGWQGHGHIHVLVYIPQALLLWQQGWICHSRSFLSGWWTEMVVFTHLAPRCPPHCEALPISHCTSPAPTSFPFFPVACLHPYPLYAQPCSLHVKSSSFWQ